MVKGFAIVGLVLMGTCLFGQSSKQYMKAAEQYIENGYYQEAVNQYTKALELDPQNGQAYEDRGKVLEHLGKLKEASGDFRSAAVFNINSAENYYHSAQLLNDLEDYKQALINIRHALSQKQKFQEAYILQCEIYLTVNDPANALKAAENAIDVKNTSYACYLRGKANVLLDHTQEAEQDFEKAIIKDKLHLDAYMALAELQLNTGKIRYAIENSSYIIKTDKENAHAYLIRSQCYDRLKDQEKSISDISKAIVLDSANIDYYIIRGKYYAGFAQYQNAINDFTIALDQDMTRVDALYGRAEAYEKIGNKPGSVSDYSLLLNFSADIEPDLAAAVKNKLFELNKESVKPRITLSDPVPNSNFQVPVPNDKDYIDLSAIVEDNSKIRFLKINNDTLLNDPEGKREKEFTTRIETDNLEFITVSATDIYDNSATVSYAIERIETHSPQIFLRNPYVGDDGTITVKPDDYYLYLDGQIEDESPISSIKIEDVNASYAPGDINPRFTATLDIRQKNRIKIIATDKYGNVNEQEYLFRLDGRILNENSPMGKTWVVLIENSDYKEFPNLKSPGRDILLMQQALNRYNINKVIVKRNLTKRELERFFAIDLRDLIRANHVNSLFVWFAGHGKTINNTGYWIPSDASVDVEFSYFNINALKASLYSYTPLTHLLVVSDACETGEDFCLALRGPVTGAACSNTQLALKKSAQVFTSAGTGYAYDNSMFSRAFANALLNNEDDCITIDDVAKRVSIIMQKSSLQTPEFGRIKGLEDELGTFFFITR